LAGLGPGCFLGIVLLELPGPSLGLKGVVRVAGGHPFIVVFSLQVENKVALLLWRFLLIYLLVDIHIA
jgi:hypothetical protein